MTISVEIAEQLPFEWKSQLVLQFQKLALCYFDMGRHEDGVQAARKTLELWQTSLPAERNTDFIAMRASLLGVLATRLWQMGQLENARVAAQESVDLYQDLSKTLPGTFVPPLADELCILGNITYAFDRPNEATKLFKQAVTLLRSLGTETALPRNQHLAFCLRQLSEHYRRIGNLPEALVTIEESLGIYDKIKDDPSTGINHQHPEAFRYYALLLLMLQRRGEALKAIEESISIIKLIADQWPVRYNRELAQALHIRYHVLVNLVPPRNEPRNKEGFAALNEAIELLRPWKSADPSDNNHCLHECLSSLALWYEAYNMAGAARAARSEAAALAVVGNAGW